MNQLFKYDLNEKKYHSHLIGIFIASIYLGILLATAKDIGFARDEGFYFSASEQYGRWFKILVTDPQEAIKKRVIDRHWRINSEHPSLMKSLFAISYIIFYEKLDIMPPSTSFRFPGMLMSALLLYLVVLFGMRIGGVKTAIFASLSLALMPRYFYHSHLDCFDVPMATMWFATAYSFLKSFTSWKWAIITGIVWGVALETKLNGFFLPVVFLIYYIIFFARNFKLTGPNRNTRSFIKIPPIPLAFISMLIIGPLVFWALWPWLWYDTIERLRNYLGFHMHHPYYNIEYFGYTYFKPPFPISYPFIMTLITIPLTTSILCICGIISTSRYSIMRIAGRMWKLPPEVRLREERLRGINLFLLLNMLFPMVLIAIPSTPIFGGTKHWLPSWPYIALYAGIGFSSVSGQLGKLVDTWSRDTSLTKIRKTILTAASGLLFLTAPAQQTEASHPFGLSHYTLPIGETPGSADAGMCRQFWGFTTGSIIWWLNENAPPGAKVYFHDTAWDSYNMYHRDGTLRKDIMWNGTIEGSDIAMVHWEQHMSSYEYAIWTWMGKVNPSYVLTHQGVTILPIYKK